MKKSLMLITTTLAFFTITSFADQQKTIQLKDLGSTFRTHTTVVPKIDPRDITMGYAGQDVVNRKTTIAL